MGIDIIDSFRLGTDKPLDNRYIVNSIYDVSMYWFAGMQMFEPSLNQLWVVRDVSNEIIEPIVFDYDILDGGTNWITPIEGQINGGSW